MRDKASFVHVGEPERTGVMDRKKKDQAQHNVEKFAEWSVTLATKFTGSAMRTGDLTHCGAPKGTVSCAAVK